MAVSESLWTLWTTREKKICVPPGILILFNQTRDSHFTSDRVWFIIVSEGHVSFVLCASCKHFHVPRNWGNSSENSRCRSMRAICCFVWKLWLLQITYPHTHLYNKKDSQLTFIQHFNTDVTVNMTINSKSIYIHIVTKVSPIQPSYNRVSQRHLLPALVHWERELWDCTPRNFPFVVMLQFLCTCDTQLKFQKLLNKGKSILISPRL
jgi:hypothetical protein